MSGSAETQMVEHYAAVRRKFFDRAPLPPKATPPRPLSPFSPSRIAVAAPPSRLALLFPKPIVEIDNEGNDVLTHSVFTPMWKIIATETARKHKVSMIDLLSARRDHAVVLARHECFWRCRRETTMSLPQIGQRFGGRDHTTVLHGVQTHERRMMEASSTLAS